MFPHPKWLRTPGGRKAWTVFVYMAADVDGKLFTNDKIENEIAAIESAVKEHPDARVELLADMREGTGIRGTVSDGSLEQRRLEKEPVFSSPETLENFLRDGQSRHPDDHYLVLLWGHGYGPAGLRYEKKTLDPRQLAQALRNVFGIFPADLVAFMSCHMSTIELAYEFEWKLALQLPPLIKKAADFVLASQGVVNPLKPFPYSQLFGVLAKNPEAKAAGRQLIDVLGTQYEAPFSLLDVSLSAPVRKALTTLASVLSKRSEDSFTAHHPLATPLRDALHNAIAASIPAETEKALLDLVRLGRQLAAIPESASHTDAEKVDLKTVQTAAPHLVRSVESGLVVHTGPKGEGERQLNGVSVYCPPHHRADMQTSPIEAMVLMAEYTQLSFSQPFLGNSWVDVIRLAHQ